MRLPVTGTRPGAGVARQRRDRLALAASELSWYRATRPAEAGQALTGGQDRRPAGPPKLCLGGRSRCT